MIGKPRLLPVLILAAALTIGVKLGDLWRGADDMMAGLSVAPAQAQESSAEAAAGEGAENQAEAAAPAATPERLEPDAVSPVEALEAAEEAEAEGDEEGSSRLAIGRAGGDESTLRLLLRQAIDGLVEEQIDAVLAKRRKGQDSDDFYSEAEVRVLQSLSRRRDVLDQRESEIGMRENLLGAAEKRIDQKIAKLKKIEDSIQASLKKYDKQEEAQMKSLVKIYESMKPKDAARIMQQLDMAVLLEVSERMREQKMAAILAKMNGEIAKTVTMELANRRPLPTAGG